MNKNIFLITAALVLPMVSGCDKSRVAGFPEDRVIRVSAEVGPLTKGENTTANLKEFHLIVNNATAPSYSSLSRKFSKSDSGEWNPESTLLWHNATDPVDLIAIAPFVGGFTYSQLDGQGCTISTQQSSSYRNDDLIAWSHMGFVPQDDLVDGKVQIEFKHLMSKLNITFKLGNEFNAGGIPQTNPVRDVEVSGIYGNGVMSLSPTEGLSISADSRYSPTYIQPYWTGWHPAADEDAACTASYAGIVIPSHVDAGGMSIAFEMNGIPYIWSNPAALDFEANKAYNITIKVGKDRVKAGSITAAAWDNQPETGLETE